MPEGLFKFIADQVRAKRDADRKREELISIRRAAIGLAERASAIGQQEIAGLLIGAAGKAEEAVEILAKRGNESEDLFSRKD